MFSHNSIILLYHLLLLPITTTQARPATPSHIVIASSPPQPSNIGSPPFSNTTTPPTDPNPNPNPDSTPPQILYPLPDTKYSYTITPTPQTPPQPLNLPLPSLLHTLDAAILASNATAEAEFDSDPDRGNPAIAQAEVTWALEGVEVGVGSMVGAKSLFTWQTVTDALVGYRAFVVERNETRATKWEYTHVGSRIELSVAGGWVRAVV